MNIDFKGEGFKALMDVLWRLLAALEKLAGLPPSQRS
jgi:hypothetical protein